MIRLTRREMVSLMIRTERLLIREYEKKDVAGRAVSGVISFVKGEDGAPIYENTCQYAILKREWEQANKK